MPWLRYRAQTQKSRMKSAERADFERGLRLQFRSRAAWRPLIGYPSIAAAAQFAPESVDFIMIAASHDPGSVRDDVRARLPELKPGGMTPSPCTGWPSGSSNAPEVGRTPDSCKSNHRRSVQQR
jgi:hypothetical protein